MAKTPRWQDVISAVDALAAPRASNADDCRAVCRAIMAQDDGTQGRELFDGFCQRADAYVEADATALWDAQLEVARAGPETLFRIAAADGWSGNGRKPEAAPNKQKGGATPRTEAPAPNPARRTPEAATAPHSSGAPIHEPPKNLNAERTVLGSCLIDGSACATVLDTLKAVQFYATAHQVIFEAIKAVHDAGDIAADLVSVAEHMDRKGSLDQCGGAAYLASFAQHVLTTQNVAHYCRLVHDAWSRRELIQQAHEIIEDCHRQDIDSAELFEATERRVKEVALAEIGEKNALSIHSLDTLFDIETSEHDNVVGDRAVRGDDLTVIFGPPGIGKSRVVTQLAIDMALGKDWFGHLPIHQRDLKWLFFQTENGVRRLKFELGKQLKGISGETRANLAENLLILAPVKISDRLLSFKSPEAIARMRAAVRRHDPDLVVFDPYIQFFGGESENDTTQAAEAIAEFYSIAHSVRADNGLIIVHHARMGKAAAASAVGWESGHYGRGSTAVVAASRSAINIAPGNAERDGLLVVAHGKCNDGREFEPFAVRLDPEFMLYEHEPDFDLGEWSDTVNNVSKGRRRKAEVIHAVNVIKAGGGLIGWKPLIEGIKELTGCADRTAGKVIKEGLAANEIRIEAGAYALPI